MARSTFKQVDLAVAIKAARKAGFDPHEVRITPDGEIRLLDRRSAGSSTEDEAAAEIAEWARGQR